ncbi:MAG: tetratricopeptide repeat protein [Bacteroidota bacterium]
MKTYALTLFMIFSTFFCFSQTAREFAEMAAKKAEAKDYKYALIMIDKAIAKNDTNQWYRLAKADIEFKLYGPREAIKTSLAAIAVNRKNSECYNRAGMYYNSAGINDSAVYFYNLAIKFAANDTTKHMYILNRGTAKNDVRDFDGAKADYEIALQFNPNDIATLNNIAAIYSELGMQQKGIAALKKIISIDKTFIGPYVNLGFIYSELDSLDLSISYFDKALLINAQDPLTYSNRGHVYYKKGNYNAALKDINYSISLYPTNSYAYRNLALVYIATKKRSEACDALKYAVDYGFEKMYGDEVNELIKKHCK